MEKQKGFSCKEFVSITVSMISPEDAKELKEDLRINSLVDSRNIETGEIIDTEDGGKIIGHYLTGRFSRTTAASITQWLEKRGYPNLNDK